jgi:uncharacterized glyoxalase superfamily protein PhnB
MTLTVPVRGIATSWGASSMTLPLATGGFVPRARSCSCSVVARTFPPASELGDHSYIAYLSVDDVDAFHARAVAAGADVLQAPQDQPWGMRELALRSPDGHRFTLGQPIESG